VLTALGGLRKLSPRSSRDEFANAGDPIIWTTYTIDDDLKG